MFQIPEFDWSPWIDLLGANRHPLTPKQAGVYRIRDVTQGAVIYVGETVNLRNRFSHLQQAFKPEIPYADPHTAAPALWAHLRDNDTSLEISFTTIPGDRARRMSVESAYIAILRQQIGESPMANFGQMPNGWTKSSGNSKKLVDTGKRFKGSQDKSAVRTPSAPSILDLSNSPLDIRWANLAWSSWATFPENLPETSQIGLYRIRRPDSEKLSYIGQGKIFARLKAHSMKYGIDGHAQSSEFAPGFLASWVNVEVTHARQLLELEDDLIASHFIAFGKCPTAQFIG